MAGIPGRSGGANRRSAKEHQLRGTYRADRHGPLPPDEAETEPLPPPNPYPPPADLTGAARRHWRYFAPLLQSARVQTPSDSQTLADYCRACAAVNDRDRRLAGIMRKRQIDWSLQGRLDRELRGWMERKTKLASELGLTPLSRSRVGWTGHAQRPTTPVSSVPAEPKSKLSELQDQAAALRRPMAVK
jgi:hypothetical protein